MEAQFEDVECAFKIHAGHNIHETFEAGHGRIETRKCSILPAKEYIQEEKADYFASLIRGYWSIENQLHWHPDITFKKDACRTIAGYASQNLSVLRKNGVAYHLGTERQIELQKETIQSSIGYRIS